MSVGLASASTSLLGLAVLGRRRTGGASRGGHGGRDVGLVGFGSVLARRRLGLVQIQRFFYRGQSRRRRILDLTRYRHLTHSERTLDKMPRRSTQTETR